LADAVIQACEEVIGGRFDGQFVVDVFQTGSGTSTNLEKSLSLVTALVPEVGYDQSAALAKKSYQTGKTINKVAKENNILPPEKTDEILDRMIGGK
jgi:fumarate hydratase class II